MKTYNETMNHYAGEPFNNCKQCGKCCKGAIYISKTEFKQLEGQPVVNNGIGCPFLGKQNQCTVYEFRPFICRVFGHKREMYDGVQLHPKVIIATNGACPNAKETVERLTDEMRAFWMGLYQNEPIICLSQDRSSKYMPWISYFVEEERGVAVLKENLANTRENFEKFMKALETD